MQFIVRTKLRTIKGKQSRKKILQLHKNLVVEKVQAARLLKKPFKWISLVRERSVFISLHYEIASYVFSHSARVGQVGPCSLINCLISLALPTSTLLFPNINNKRVQLLWHFLWTMDGPFSVNSSLVMTEAANVEREARVEAPFQTAYLRSGWAMILISEGDKAVSSLLSLSGRPSYMVEPPERMTFLQSSFLTSKSAFWMDVQVRSWTDLQFLPLREGLKRSSAVWILTRPGMVIWDLSGRV